MSNSQETNIDKEKKGRKFPHVYVVLLSFIVLCAILTYIVPAGEYDRVETSDGRMVVDPTFYSNNGYFGNCIRI